MLRPDVGDGGLSGRWIERVDTASRSLLASGVARDPTISLPAPVIRRAGKESYAETQFTYEDGRKGRIRATLSIQEAEEPGEDLKVAAE